MVHLSLLHLLHLFRLTRRAYVAVVSKWLREKDKMVSSPAMKGVVGIRRPDWFEPGCHREGFLQVAFDAWTAAKRTHGSAPPSYLSRTQRCRVRRIPPLVGGDRDTPGLTGASRQLGANGMLVSILQLHPLIAR
jgi:hypothetical protein